MLHVDIYIVTNLQPGNTIIQHDGESQLQQPAVSPAGAQCAVRTGGEHEAGRSQVVVLSAPLRSVTKYCYGHLAHGDVALLPQPLLLGLRRGARAEAEGPPARVLRGQRSLTQRSDSGQYHA